MPFETVWLRVQGMLREKRFVAAAVDGTLNWQGRLFWLGVASASFHLRLASSGISQVVTPTGAATQTREFPGQGEILAGTLPLGSRARLPVDRWLVWPAVILTGVVALCGFWLALWERKPKRALAIRTTGSTSNSSG